MKAEILAYEIKQKRDFRELVCRGKLSQVIDIFTVVGQEIVFILAVLPFYYDTTRAVFISCLTKFGTRWVGIDQRTKR